MKKIKFVYDFSNGNFAIPVCNGCVKSKWADLEEIQWHWSRGSQVYAGCSINNGKIGNIWMETVQGSLRCSPGFDIYGNLRFGNVSSDWSQIRRSLEKGKIPDKWSRQAEQVLQTFRALYELNVIDEEAFEWVMGKEDVRCSNSV